MKTNKQTLKEAAKAVTERNHPPKKNPNQKEHKKNNKKPQSIKTKQQQQQKQNPFCFNRTLFGIIFNPSWNL